MCVCVCVCVCVCLSVCLSIKLLVVDEVEKPYPILLLWVYTVHNYYTALAASVLDYTSTGNRTRAEDIRDHAHPYMRPGPFFPGQFPAANVQLLKDGRLAPTGMELGTGDPRLGTLDISM